ncbi:hypothetical protein [Mycobacterium aquaticum]|uniref:Uncharacterized protein n=1 Tax=Mycobacterium aquaticum TaxID=1927124 RepID=A0A1X0A0C4_9MYCO|nr:hypothetical protein [Mycobacterium aquaticum]ORA23392.1 hypothetical protein BST13_35145 [Mycobacterium aquaticum]
MRSELARITYKPGWEFTLYDTGGELQLAVVTPEVPCSRGGPPIRVGAPTTIPPTRTRTEFHAFVRAAIDTVESHEIDEWLKVDGHPMNDPHK